MKRLDLLAMQYSIYLVVVIVLLYIGFDLGLIAAVLASDVSRLSAIIGAVFIYGMLICSYRVFQVSILSNLKLMGGELPKLQAKAENRVAHIDLVARLLFRGGLCGTVYGMWVAMDGLDLENLTNTQNLASEIGVLFDGVRIAIVTTLVGVSGNILLSIALSFLESGYTEVLDEET